MLVELAGERILLDAGTGLTNLDAHARPAPQTCTLLLSHAHLDHLLGLTTFAPLYAPDFQATVYARARDGLGAKEQVARMMSPPLWPIGPEAFRADLSWRALPDGSFRVGEVTIDHAEGNHPGGATVFRLSAGGVSVVYATDCELDADTARRLRPLAADCDLLLCDAEHTDTEHAQRPGWGHSTVGMALAFSDACRARRTSLIHHAPDRTDADLDAMAISALVGRPDCAFGKQGDVFWL